MSSAWFPSNMMLGIAVLQTRKSCFSQSEDPLQALFFFTEEMIVSGHISIKHRLVECCSEVCPSVGFSYLHIWSWSSTRGTISFLVTSLTKALLHQLLSLARRPALRRVDPNIFQMLIQMSSIMDNGCYVILWIFNALYIFIWTLPQMCGLMQFCLWVI